MAVIDKEIIAKELKKDFFLRTTNKGSNEIYCFSQADAPNTMLEIGRLREEAFSYYGGGTGKEYDIDDYDKFYKQLVVWDPLEKNILGAYRYIHGRDALRLGVAEPFLATARMFDLSEDFIRNYLPYTIELGRSFVSLHYQNTQNSRKGIFALDNLWDGIGALTRVLPNTQYLYGKVTMFQTYSQRARNLIRYFLSLYFKDNKELVKPKKPLEIKLLQEDLSLFSASNYDEDFKILNREIRAMGISIPPLVHAYMNLSPEMKVFGSAMNESFGSVEETGIFISIEKIANEKKARHIDSFDISQKGGLL